MDPLSRLPVECLERILHIIASTVRGSSRVTLVSLLRVNRHIAQVTLPFLYRNPLPSFNPLSMGNMRAPKLRSLVRTLIASIPNSHHIQLHPGLTSELDLDTTTITRTEQQQLTSSTPLNYLDHVRHLDLQHFTFVEYDETGRPKSAEAHPPQKLSYILGQDMMDMYLTDRKDAYCSIHSNKPSEQLLAYYMSLLYREAVWTLATPILNQLESLTFTLSDTPRYLSIVDRLCRLEHVTVILDRAYMRDCCPIPISHPVRSWKEEAVQHVVQFAREHTRIFPGRLKTLRTTPDCIAYNIGSCSREINTAVARILPPYELAVLSSSNWLQVSSYIQTMDFGHVMEITHLDPTVVDGQLLQRCRALKALNQRYLVPGCFDWAVRERRDAETLGQNRTARRTASAYNSVTSLTDSPQPTHWTHSLVSLEKIVLHEHSMSSSQNLDAIAFAFSQSLKYLHIDSVHGEEHFEKLHIGRGWPGLPALERLKLCAPRHRLALDPVLLAQCPFLSAVKVKDDETFEYLYRDIVPCLPASLPRLIILYLKGWSALTFHPRTLESTKELLVLKLSTARIDGSCFIPPANELKGSFGLGSPPVSDLTKRSCWTWDWYLPRLLHMQLTSEFAYLFEFKMLVGCPSLESLHLHMPTIDGNHTRVICEADLLVFSEDGSQERIVAPALRGLHMNGCWVVEEPSELSQFIGHMFPKLERLVMRGWRGITVGSMVKTIRTTAGHVKMVRTDLVDPTAVEEVELGMYRRSGVYRKGPKTLQTRLFCSEKEYVLLRQ